MAHHLLTVKRVRAVMIVMFPRHSALVEVSWIFIATFGNYRFNFEMEGGNHE